MSNKSIDPRAVALIAITLTLVLGAVPAWGATPLAYVGPGAGLTTIGALVAVAAMFFLALLGPILYPIRLIRRRMKKNGEQTIEGADPVSEVDDPTSTNA